MRLMKVLTLVISLIAFTLAFFLLIVSIAANIADSTYEIAVLRSMGMEKKDIVDVYVLEALANNISAIGLGICVGIIISSTLGM